MADISNSLKVVNIALVFCASFSLLAIFNLIRFIFTLCSLLVPAISALEQLQQLGLLVALVEVGGAMPVALLGEERLQLGQLLAWRPLDQAGS